MPRTGALAFALVLFPLFAAGCGGSSTTEVVEEPPAGSLEALWRKPGEDVAIVPGTADFAPGRVRLSFLVVDGQGQVVTRPTARVWLARGLDREPFLETTATSEPIGVESSEEEAGASQIFVTRLEIRKPGKYWVLAEPVGGRRIQAVGNVVVAKETVAPDVGDPAIASRTPTIASTGGDLAALSTQKPPDRELLRSSIAEALAAKVPFVVAFATPQFCTTRTCGPIVDVVGAVRRRFADAGIRFIHVEIYTDNDPAKGTNRWVNEWKLPSEPFTFLVGADGLVKDRFEGTFSVRELTAAVERELVR
ncbi:MAG: hypothetical protein MSC30_06635 [Gaiellaceae bacterium MAG52_C11]|nr:hypothetical protein [Candidatus Gaiellasilicea maunaloa]